MLLILVLACTPLRFTLGFTICDISNFFFNFFYILAKNKHMAVIHYMHPDCKGNKFIVAKTNCNKYVDSVADFDTRLEYVTCKTCIKNSYKRMCY